MTEWTFYDNVSDGADFERFPYNSHSLRLHMYVCVCACMRTVPHRALAVAEYKTIAARE